MTTVKNIYDFLQEKAPFQYQAGFDNAGFLVGRSDASVQRVLVALDITQEVVDEAIELDAQLIVAHHPVIFGGVKRLTDETPEGAVLLSLAEHQISAICAHTNLDAIQGGVNDVLALKLGLCDIEQLHQEGVDQQGNPYGIGRVGVVHQQSVDEFARWVKESLGAAGVRVVDAGTPVRRVAVGGGACGDMLEDAVRAGCDTFVTSDVKYHIFLQAKSYGLNLLDAGHYATENVVCPVVAAWIQEAFPSIQVMVSQRHTEIYHCV